MKNDRPTSRLLFTTCFLFLWFILFAILPVSLLADDSIALISHKSVPESSLSSTDVMNIFLGKKTTWDNGSKITFVTLKGGNTNKTFLRTYVKRNPTQFKNHWKKMLFTGKGVIPQSFSTDEEVIDYVSKNENVVGYIAKESVKDGLKIISITN